MIILFLLLFNVYYVNYFLNYLHATSTQLPIEVHYFKK